MSRLSPQEEITLLRKKARRRLVGAIALVAIAIAVLWNTLGKAPQQVHPEQIAIVPESTSSGLAQPPATPSGQPPLTIQEPERHQTSEPAAITRPEPVPQTITTQTTTRPASATASSTDDAAAKAKAEQEKAAKEKKAQEEKRLAAEKARKEKEKAATQAQERQPKPPTTEQPPKPKKPEPDPAAILDGRADAGNQPPRPAADAASKRVMIQLAALTDQSKIDTMKGKLSQLGVSASYSKVQTSKGEATRVRVGPFASRAEADATMAKLAQAGLSGIVLP